MEKATGKFIIEYNNKYDGCVKLCNKNSGDGLILSRQCTLVSLINDSMYRAMDFITFNDIDVENIVLSFLGVQSHEREEVLSDVYVKFILDYIRQYSEGTQPDFDAECMKALDKYRLLSSENEKSNELEDKESLPPIYNFLKERLIAPSIFETLQGSSDKEKIDNYISLFY